MRNSWMRLECALVLLVLVLPSCATAQQVGDCVRVAATNPAGVPIHDRPENSFSGHRFADGAVLTVIDSADAGHWLKLRGDEREGWVVETYVAGVVDCDAAATGGIVFATWNLEYFGLTSTRGFPELPGQIPARTDTDYATIASIIRELDLSIVALQEVEGVDPPEPADDEARTTAPAIERLLAEDLGGTFDYRVARTGGKQRTALLWDRDRVGLNWTCEADLDNPSIDGKDVFDRQPLLGYFTVFRDGVEMNDLAVVVVHLASGRDNVHNHDVAMSAIDAWLDDTAATGWCVPLGERDIIIAGDFNASRFDDDEEAFWEAYESDGWDVLADDAATYPATRLTKNPPRQLDSVIDYIIVSDGLRGSEVTAETATVHGELVADGLEFRTRASDHLPVTVVVGVGVDDD